MAILGIAILQAEAGNVDKALGTTRLIKETTRDFAIRRIAAFASFEQANKLVEESTNDYTKATVWINVGRRCAERGDHRKAREAFGQAAALSRQITDPPGVINARLGTVLELTESVARAGFLEDAVALADAQREPRDRAGALLGILAGMNKK
jgi:hypothetical protein